MPSSALLAAASSLAPGEHSRHFEQPGCRRVSAAGAAVAQCPSSAAQPTKSAALCRPQQLLIPPNRGFASREIGTSPRMGRRLAQLSLAAAAEAVAEDPCSPSQWWCVSSGTRPGAPARTRPLPQAPKAPLGRAAGDYQGFLGTLGCLPVWLLAGNMAESRSDHLERVRDFFTHFRSSRVS